MLLNMPCTIAITSTTVLTYITEGTSLSVLGLGYHPGQIAFVIDVRGRYCAIKALLNDLPSVVSM